MRYFAIACAIRGSHSEDGVYALGRNAHILNHNSNRMSGDGEQVSRNVIYMSVCTNYSHLQSVSAYGRVCAFGYLQSVERWKIGCQHQMDVDESIDDSSFLKVFILDPLSSFKKVLKICIFGMNKVLQLSSFWEDQKSFEGKLVMISSLKKNDKALSGDAYEINIKVFSQAVLEIGEERITSLEKKSTPDTSSKILSIAEIELETQKCFGSLKHVTVNGFGETRNGKPFANISQDGRIFELFLWQNHPAIEEGLTYDFEGLHVTPTSNRVFRAMSRESRASISIIDNANTRNVDNEDTQSRRGYNFNIY